MFGINEQSLNEATDHIWSDIEAARVMAALEALPHGSGINCEWFFESLKNGKIRAYNEYSAMNEAGYYVADIPFTLTVDLDALDFRLTFGPAGRYWRERLDLRSYLEDTFAYWMSELD